MRQSFTMHLTDADPDHDGSIPVRIVGNQSAISIFPEGYGDFGRAWLSRLLGTLPRSIAADCVSQRQRPRANDH